MLFAVLISHIAAAAEGLGERHLVGVFQVRAHRDAVGDAGHADTQGLDEPGDIGRGGLALDVRIGGKDDLLDAAVGQAGEQLADADVVRAHAVHR